MKTRNLIIGKLGEEIAVQYLIEKNYKILDRNYKISFAEIDIIALDGDTIAIIEVKTRKNFIAAEASGAVNFKKQERLRKAAKNYIMIKRLYDYNLRFDVIECYWDLNKINHIKDAFRG